MFYFCHLKKLVRPETFGLYYVHKLTRMRVDILTTIGVNYRVFVFWLVPPFRPTGGSKGSSTRAFYVDTCPRTRFGTVRRQFFLYADIVCCLPPRMENNRQSVQVWTRSRTVGVHCYFLQCIISFLVEFERLTCGRRKEFLLVLSICSAVRVCGVCTVHITKTVLKNVMRLVFL